MLIELGKKEVDWKNTDRPEKPREKAINENRKSLLISLHPPISRAALLTSKKEQIIGKTVLLFIKDFNALITPEKRIMNEETLIEDSPAFLTESGKLNVCLIISSE